MVLLREMGLEHIDLVLSIIIESDEEDFIVAKRFFSYYFDLNSSENKSCQMFVVLNQGLIIGCVGFKQDSYSSGVFELIWFYLRKKWQRKGIGTEVLILIEQKICLKGGRLLVVETGYEGASYFYQSNGFLFCGQIDDYYELGVHSRYLSKRLN